MKYDETLLKQIGEEFGSAVAELVNRGITRIVTVKKVEDNFAEVEDFEGDPLLRVPLRFLNIGTTVLKIVPKVDTTAAIVLLEGGANTPYFVGFSEVESTELLVGDSSVLVESDKITFNGGENKGMVLVEKLIDRLNDIENDINDLKTAFSGWTPAPQDGGAALKGAVSSWSGSRLTPSQVSDIENEKIVQ